MKYVYENILSTYRSGYRREIYKELGYGTEFQVLYVVDWELDYDKIGRYYHLVVPLENWIYKQLA